MKNQISVYDYMNAVRNRIELHHVLTLREPTSIEDACQIAKNHEYWQEYNFVTYGTSQLYVGPYRPMKQSVSTPFYPTTTPYQIGYMPNNSLNQPGMTMPVPSRSQYSNYWTEPSPYGIPMTMPPYPASEPMMAIPPYNPLNTFSNARGTFNRSARTLSSTPGQLAEKRCWRCGQPGHLQKDCGRLNH